MLQVVHVFVMSMHTYIHTPNSGHSIAPTESLVVTLTIQVLDHEMFKVGKTILNISRLRICVCSNLPCGVRAGALRRHLLEIWTSRKYTGAGFHVHHSVLICDWMVDGLTCVDSALMFDLVGTCCRWQDICRVAEGREM